MTPPLTIMVDWPGHQHFQYIQPGVFRLQNWDFTTFYMRYVFVCFNFCKPGGHVNYAIFTQGLLCTWTSFWCISCIIIFCILLPTFPLWIRWWLLLGHVLNIWWELCVYSVSRSSLWYQYVDSMWPRKENCHFSFWLQWQFSIPVSFYLREQFPHETII